MTRKHAKTTWALLLLLLIGPVSATPIWTNYGTVGDVYTYTVVDSLAVYLNGSQCVNQKPYYFVHPVQAANAKQLITMVLTAKASGKQISIYADSTLDTTHCYIVGVRIRD